jgi:hypothetical protein
MSIMGYLGSNRSDEFFGQTHSTGRLDMTDALETVVSIKPKLENSSIEVLPKHDRIMFTSSNDLGHKEACSPEWLHSTRCMPT